MKKIAIALIGLFAAPVITLAVAQDSDSLHFGHHRKPGVIDTRIQLDVSPEIKRHQLANMREHVQAIQSILEMIASGKFDEASELAHAKLGLTPEMKAMCGSFGNAKFEQLGLEFHNSADALGETLKTKDVTASLHAVSLTMQYCVSCHATFRQ